MADTEACWWVLQVRALACRLLAALVQRSEHLRFRLLQHLAALLPLACQSGAHAHACCRLSFACIQAVSAWCSWRCMQAQASLLLCILMA